MLEIIVCVLLSIDNTKCLSLNVEKMLLGRKKKFRLS